MNKVVMTAAILSVLTACGKKDKDSPEDDAGGTTVGTSELAADRTLVAEEAASQTDDAINAMLSGSETSDATSLSLTSTGFGWGVTGELVDVRDCVVDDEAQHTTVSIERTMSRAITRKTPRLELSREVTGSAKITRVWSKGDASVPCNDKKTWIVVPLEEREGLKLAAQFERSYSAKGSMTRRGETITRERSKEIKGSHEVSWQSVSSEGDAITVQKEIKVTAERKVKAQDKAGRLRERSSSLSTKEPLIVELKRDATSKAVLERTIVSGTLVGQGSDGGRIETTFNNVVYPVASACKATSGTISGAIYEKDATEPKAEFTITFSDDAETSDKAVYADGEEVDFAIDECDLNQPETVTIKAKGE